MESPTFRSARPADADALAGLHAESWRRYYRGAYADAFLDGDVVSDRLAVWTDRLREPPAGTCTVVAEVAGAVVGFAHTVLDASPVWGALLDNLHVVVGHQRHGVGTRLMARSAAFVVDQRPGSRLHLWVLEVNVAAQHFYRAAGGRLVGTAPVEPVGGVPGRLVGSPVKLRFAWSDPSVLWSLG